MRACEAAHTLVRREENRHLVLGPLELDLSALGVVGTDLFTVPYANSEACQ